MVAADATPLFEAIKSTRAATHNVISALLEADASAEPLGALSLRVRGGVHVVPPSEIRGESQKLIWVIACTSDIISEDWSYLIKLLTAMPSRFISEPMRIDLNSDKPIFQSPHKLGQVVCNFVEAQCKKLEGLGFIKRSTKSMYASATVVVCKKDEGGNYIDFR